MQKRLSFFERLRRRLLRALRRFLRFCYRLGPRVCIFLAGVAVFVIVGVVLICTVPAARSRKVERTGLALAEASASAALPEITPDPAVLSTPTPSPSATPDVTLQKGDKTEEVAALQLRLMELGYLGIDEPTQYYGNATKAAVQLFQRQHELQQDGIAGAQTQELLYGEAAKPYVMYEGAEGSDIEDFQELLVELGYLESNQVTGYYGTDTVAAVRKFQQRNHLTKDGKAGEKTIETINSADARVSYEKEQEIEEEKKKAAAAARAQTAEGRIDKMISIAKKQLGKPYILGAKGPSSFDCSGLAYYCLRQVDVYTRRLNASGLSRTSSWTKVSSLDDVKRGDLLFFKSDDSSSVGHVGIYIGSGEMIDASSANGEVVRRSAKSSYWRRNFVCARRPIE